MVNITYSKIQNLTEIERIDTTDPGVCSCFKVRTNNLDHGCSVCRITGWANIKKTFQKHSIKIKTNSIVTLNYTKMCFIYISSHLGLI